MNRYVNTGIWDSPWVRSLSAYGRYIYVYLLTNPLTNIAGVYPITGDRIAFDTGLSVGDVMSILSSFSASRVVVYASGYIIIPAWPSRQKWQEMPRIKVGIISILQALPGYIFDQLSALKYTFDLRGIVNNNADILPPNPAESSQSRQISREIVKIPEIFDIGKFSEK